MVMNIEINNSDTECMYSVSEYNFYKKAMRCVTENQAKKKPHQKIYFKKGEYYF